MKDPDTSSSSPSLKATYFAASIGVVALVVVDSLQNGNSATAIKIGEAIKRLLGMADFGYGALLAVVFLVVMASAWCWMERPASLKDAFIRGFTIFAFLTVAAPYDNGTSTLTATAGPAATPGGLTLVSPAHGQETAPRSNAIIRLPGVQRAEVTLRDAESGAILARSLVVGQEVRISQPSGKYLLEIEAPGYRRTQVPLDLRASSQQFTLKLEPTPIPLGLQRFYAPEQEILRTPR
jgi:hypothetical protein